jgi:hypothetical protein
MPRVEMRRITREDCEAIAPRLRSADALEIQRSLGEPGLAVLLRSVEASERSGVVLFDGEPACAYGLVRPDVIGPFAVPWLLTTDVVERHRFTFFRIAKAVVDLWAEENPVLFQMVDDEYEGAKLFLRKLGFQIYPPVPHGVSRAPFCPAVRQSNV